MTNGKIFQQNIAEKNEREMVIESLTLNCHSRKIQNWIPTLAIKHTDQTSLWLNQAEQFFSFSHWHQSLQESCVVGKRKRVSSLEPELANCGLTCVSSEGTDNVWRWPRIKNRSAMYHLETWIPTLASEVNEVAQLIYCHALLSLPLAGCLLAPR